jgi:hypothetical protein
MVENVKSGRVANWFKTHWTLSARLDLARTTQNPQVLKKLATDKDPQVRFQAAMNEKCHWIDVAVALSKMPLRPDGYDLTAAKQVLGIHRAKNILINTYLAELNPVLHQALISPANK